MRKVIFSVIGALLMCGCDGILAQRMVAPPNGGLAMPVTRPTAPGFLHIPVGPPDAVLAGWVLEPKGEARGTILVLHGFLLDHHFVQGAAEALRDAGYRAVLLDLRGHGQSSGAYITYGAQDAHDLVGVTTYLQAHHLCGDAVGVYGTSYGAASAILFAGADPRVKAVVAVAPYASLREEAPYFGKHLLPVPGLFMSDSDYAHVVDRMGQIAGFNPDDSAPLEAIRRTQAHVRLFQGDDDMFVKPGSASELAAADPERSKLSVLHGKGHLELCLDASGALQPETRAWFDRYLAAPVTPVQSTDAGARAETN